MANLHLLKSNTKRVSGKRVGRGGKRGTTSGKGQKGQKSRAGHRIRPASRDLLIRIPKLRGFKNKPLQNKAVGVSLDKILGKIKGNTIDLKALVEAGLVRKAEKRVKILDKGELDRPLEVKGIEVSAAVSKKIEAAGGSIKK